MLIKMLIDKYQIDELINAQSGDMHTAAPRQWQTGQGTTG